MEDGITVGCGESLKNQRVGRAKKISETPRLLDRQEYVTHFLFQRYLKRKLMPCRWKKFTALKNCFPCKDHSIIPVLMHSVFQPTYFEQLQKAKIDVYPNFIIVNQHFSKNPYKSQIWICCFYSSCQFGLIVERMSHSDNK